VASVLDTELEVALDELALVLEATIDELAPVIELVAAVTPPAPPAPPLAAPAAPEVALSDVETSSPQAAAAAVRSVMASFIGIFKQGLLRLRIVKKHVDDSGLMQPSHREKARVRARFLRAYEQGDSITLLAVDGGAVRATGESASLVRALLRLLVTPKRDAELLADLSALTESAVSWDGAVADAVDLLERSGAIVDVAPASDARVTRGEPRSRRPRVGLCVSGGIAAAFAPSLVELLIGRGMSVRVAATRNALRFVSAMSLEALTHEPVVSKLWPSDPKVPVVHLALASWADVVVVCPATAATISRIANGITSDVVAAVAVSARCPVVIVPSMNHRMFTSPSVERCMRKLVEDGFRVTLPSLGYEVADEPHARAPMFGAAPPVQAVVEIVAQVVAELPPPNDADDAAGWDAVYAGAPPEALPWSRDAMDADTSALLDRLVAPPARLLDIGTGTGTTAIDAARRGLSVVATDISGRALTIARARAGSLPIVWMEDDVTRTKLRGEFDVVHDRGCLHVLPPEKCAAYVDAVRDFTKEGGWLILKCHAPGGAADVGTHKFTSREIEELFRDGFELAHVQQTDFPGPDRAPSALLCALRRVRTDPRD
jgi:SAM-dependent methyltransferase/3-polyprenyl-4-hydroxybenzoate decarboxylase